MTPPIERVLLWLIATDAQLAAELDDRLDLDRLPHDDWRRLVRLVAGARGDAARALALVAAWPWGYHQFCAAAEIDHAHIVRAAQQRDELLERYNWGDRVRRIPAPSDRAVA